VIRRTNQHCSRGAIQLSGNVFNDVKVQNTFSLIEDTSTLSTLNTKLLSPIEYGWPTTEDPRSIWCRLCATSTMYWTRLASLRTFLLPIKCFTYLARPDWRRDLGRGWKTDRNRNGIVQRAAIRLDRDGCDSNWLNIVRHIFNPKWATEIKQEFTILGETRRIAR
jgi:hypothetical protein